LVILDNGIDRPTPREGKPPLPEPVQNYCLIRMKAKNKKLSTVVKREDISKVMELYGKVMKANMDGLKKVKRVKNKSKALQG
jgi:signal recognition particle subunit SRP14